MKTNEELYNLATADVKEMLRACNELPQYLERMRALEAIIEECESEKAEAYHQYDITDDSDFVIICLGKCLSGIIQLNTCPALPFHTVVFGRKSLYVVYT